MNADRQRPPNRPPSIIETPRLILRKPHVDDAEALSRNCSDTRQNLATLRLAIAAVIELWLANKGFGYVIEPKKLREPIGMIHFGGGDYALPINCEPSRKYSTQGYTMEAVKALIAWNSTPSLGTSVFLATSSDRPKSFLESSESVKMERHWMRLKQTSGKRTRRLAKDCPSNR